MPLEPSEQQIRQTIAVMGRDGISDADLETEVGALLGESMLARRMLDWLPEIFGMVLVAHMEDDITLPKTFSAQNWRGDWVEMEFDVEPLFQPTLCIAMEMYHSGPREAFGNIAMRSAAVSAVSRALEQNQSLDGASLSGPALIGVPAEIYLPRPRPFWRRLFR